MPRAPRARQPDVAERVKLFAEHHIVAVRTGRRNGEIIAVKHATYGWISPKAFYGLQKVHDVLPLITEFAKLGWAFNVAIYTLTPELVGVPIPIGPWLLKDALTPLIEGAFEAHDWTAVASSLERTVLPWGALIQVIDEWRKVLGIVIGETPETGPSNIETVKPQEPTRPPTAGPAR